MACWDIVGKLKNMLLNELMVPNTQPNTRIKYYASCGIIYDFDKRPEELIDEALGCKE